jgi:hypothetical protein
VDFSLSLLIDSIPQPSCAVSLAVIVYSVRIARIGSMVAARRAGTTNASKVSVKRAGVGVTLEQAKPFRYANYFYCSGALNTICAPFLSFTSPLVH